MCITYWTNHADDLHNLTQFAGYSYVILVRLKNIFMDVILGMYAYSRIFDYILD